MVSKWMLFVNLRKRARGSNLSAECNLASEEARLHLIDALSNFNRLSERLALTPPC